MQGKCSEFLIFTLPSHLTFRVMSTHTVTITGVLPVHKAGILPPPPPPRREINDLIKDEKQFSLYIQALRKSPPAPL